MRAAAGGWRASGRGWCGGMEALAFGRCLHELEEGAMTLGGGRLRALELTDEWSRSGEALLLLGARVKGLELGARPGSRRLGCVRRPWQAVVLCFGRVHVWQALAEGSWTGQLFVARALRFFLLRGLPQCQSLFSQKIEG